METSDILFKLKQSKQYWEMKKKIQQELQNHNSKSITVTDIQKITQSCEVEEILKNLIGVFVKKTRKREPIKEDPIDLLNVAKQKWTELLFKNLEIVHQKTNHQEEDENCKDSKLYTYDERNLLAFICTLKNQQSVNLFQNVQLQSNRLINFLIPTKPYQNTYEKYRYLLIQDEITEEKIYKIKKQIENQSLEIEIERLAQGYIPNGDRCQLYMKYFEIDHSEQTLAQNYAKLLNEYKDNTFYDDLIDIDSDEIAEDSNYFVFQDQIKSCLKSLIRDKSVSQQISIQLLNQKTTTKEFQLPQCGFLPFRNICKYIAPLCYLSIKQHIIYAIFKEFFCRYFCFLHAISSDPNSILSLCIQIEEILSIKSPKLFHHLKQIGCDTLRLVIYQVLYCFIGEMDTQQIFLIFDKIIAHNSLEILIILAVGYIQKYKSKLLLANNQQDVDKIFKEYRDDQFQDLINAAYQ